MKKQSLLALVVLTMGLMSNPAQAVTQFSVVGAGSLGLNKETIAVPVLGSIDVKGGFGYGGGLLVNFGMAANSLELGAIYLSRPVDVAGAKTSYGFVHIPAMYRFGSVLSFGLGGFYDVALDSGNSSNYGLAAGPRFSLPGGLFFDARFNYGLKSNVFASMATTKEILFLVGFMFK